MYNAQFKVFTAIFMKTYINRLDTTAGIATYLTERLCSVLKTFGKGKALRNKN